MVWAPQLFTRAWLFACACGIVGMLLLLSPGRADAAWSYISDIGPYAQNGQLQAAEGMTIDGSGNIYVADTYGHRIQKFNSAGVYQSQFGTKGSGNGQLNHPTDVAIDGGGNIWVVDSWNNRVQKFNSAGVYQSQFGSTGSGNGQFSGPSSIAMDGSGNMWVTDTNNNRVEKFNSAGTYQSQFGGSGSGNGQFNYPRGIAIKASDGSIYVADAYNYRVQQFTSAGAYSTQFGTHGGGNGQFDTAWDVKVDASGNVFVADAWYGRVQKFNSSHVWQSTIGLWGLSPMEGFSLTAVEVDGSGNIFTLDGATDKVRKFNSSGTFQSSFGSSGAGELAGAFSTARAPDGTLYTVDGANDRVLHMTTSGTVLDSWGTTGSGNGQFTNPVGIAVAPDGSVYVSDWDDNRIQKFSSTGTYLSQFGTVGSGAGQLSAPARLSIAADGSIFVADRGNNRIQKFNAAGTSVLTFGTAGSGNGQFNGVVDVETASDGSIYVLDQRNNRVQKFNSSGVYQSQFGSAGNGPGQLNNPWGMSIAPNGDIFIADGGTNYVSRFNSSGVYQERFGGPVSDRETTGFWQAYDVVASANNGVWVTETINNRIAYWTDGSPMTPPNSPRNLAQFKTNGTTSIPGGGLTNQTSAVLKFDVSDSDGSQWLIPWVEIRPIGTPLSATCGASVAGVTFSGSLVDAPAGNTYYPASVTVTDLSPGTDYHWRACALDQWSNAGAWISMGGSDGTRDLGLSGWAYQSQLGIEGQNGQLRYAQGMAVDGAGNTYVADSTNNRVQKFNSAGAYVSQFGTLGAGNGQFNYPTDIAIDSGGNIWVVDEQNNRVQKFNSAGTYQSQFGTAGSGNGQLNSPFGIAIDSSDNIFVTDMYNCRVEKFNSAGTYQSQFGSCGTGNSQFDHPAGIAIKPSDSSIYVVDEYNQRVQQFTSGGVYSTQFGSLGSGNGQFSYPMDVDVDASGNVFVADFWHRKIQKFNSSHTWVSNIGSTGDEASKLVGAQGVEVDGSGNVFVLDANSDKVVKYNSAGVYQISFGTTGLTELRYPAAVAKAPDGTIYSIDSAKAKVIHWNVSGAVLDSWGSEGSGNGQFLRAEGIAVGPDGSVYVGDWGTNTVQKFTANGTYLMTWGTTGSGNGQFSYVAGVATDSSGNVYVVDSNNHRVEKFDANGAYLGQFGSLGSGNGQLTYPTDVAVANDGSIYVTDTNNHRVEKFNSSLAYVTQFGSSGSGPGQFGQPSGVDVSPNGTVFVTDHNYPHQISRFKPDGTYIQRFGALSNFDGATGSFMRAYDIAVTADNAAWVADYGANRIAYWTFGTPSTPPAVAQSLAQYRSNGTTSIAAGGWTPQTSVVLKFNVSDPDPSQTLTPWVEIRPIGTPLSARCGASITGATFSGSTVNAVTGNTYYAASVTPTGLDPGTQYHWRACAVDDDGNGGAWWSYGGTDGTRDLGVSGWSYQSQLGAQGANGQLREPQGMTIDGSGNFYVADTLHDRVQKFDSSGNYVSQFGSTGTGNGQFHHPTDVAVDGSGNIWVVDSYNHRVQKFNSSGVYQSQFGSYGSSNGQFDHPYGIAIDGGGNIWVADSWNNRAQKFNSSGVYQSQFGSGGSGNGQFWTPMGISIKSDGSIYIADQGNHRVQKFDSAGAYQSQFGTFGGGNGQFNYPQDVKVDASGNVFVADYWNSRVQKFNSSHTYQLSFGSWGITAGQMMQTAAVDVDASGNVYALDTEHDRINKYNSAGTYLSRFGSTGAGATTMPTAIDRAPDGTLYTVDAISNKVTHFSTSGSVLHSWGSAGSGNGQFSTPWGITVAPDGSVYVSDTGNYRIQRFASDGTYLSQFGVVGSGNGQLNWPLGIAAQNDGTVLVADCGNNRVQKFTAAGAYVSQFGTLGSGNGQFTCAWDVDAASDGSIYVLDNGNDRVEKFNASGVYQLQFGGDGNAPGQTHDPSGIGVAPNGDVFVTSYGGLFKVHRFNSSGVFQEHFGDPIYDAETTGFLGPQDVVATASNAIWVAESDNNRIAYWSDGTPRTPPNSPANLAQYKSDGSTSIGSGAWSTDPSLVFTFDVSDADGSQTLTPWVEIRPMGVPLSATCGSTVPGVSFSGPTVSAPTANQTYAATVSANLTVQNQYHWRACAVDQLGNGGTWVSMGGSDGTNDVGVDAWGPSLTTISDSAGADIDSQASTSQLNGNWTAATDTAGSGTLNYDWCFTTVDTSQCAASGRIAQGLAQVATTASVSGLALNPGFTYYTCVRARDTLGNVSAYTCSDGVQVTPTASTVSGIAMRGESNATAWQGCDGLSLNIKLSVNGAAPLATSCNPITGGFTFTGVTKPGAGQVVTAWISSPDAEGATYYTVAAGGNAVAGLNIIQDRVSVDSESATATLTRSTLQTYDAVDNSDLPVDATTSSMVTIPSGMELHITPGITFTPGSSVTSGGIHVANTGVFTAAGTVTITGTGTEDDCLLGPAVGAPLCADTGGLIDNAAASSVTYLPANTTKPVAVTTDMTYQVLTLGAGGSFVLGTAAGQTLAFGTWGEFYVNGAVSSDPWSPSLTGSTTYIDVEGSWSGSHAFDVSVYAFEGGGVVTLPAAHVTLNAAQTRQPVSGWGTADWDVGSLDVIPAYTKHVFGVGGTRDFDSGGVDTPAAITYSSPNIFAVLSRPNGGTGQDWSILKYDWQGTPAAGWGTGGELVLPVAGADTVTSLVVYGSTLYVGGTRSGVWTIVALDTTTGALVPGFGSGGVWQDTSSAAGVQTITGSLTAMTRYSSSSLFVAGDDTSGTSKWEVRRISLTTGAVLDSATWNGDTGSGATQASVAGICTYQGSWTTDVYVVGRVGAAGSRDWAIGALTNSGSWGWSPFLSGASRPDKIASAGTEDRANTCNVHSSNRLIVGGTSGDGAAGDVGTIRSYDLNGALNTWWASSGVATIDGPGQDYVTSVTSYGSRIYVAGGDSMNGGRSTLRVLDDNGEFDSTFNNSTGVASWDPTGGAERAVSVALRWAYPIVLMTTGSGNDATIQEYEFDGEPMDSATGGNAWVNTWAGSRLHVHGDLTIGNNDPTRKVKLDLKAYVGQLLVDGAIRVRPDGQLRAPDASPLELGGDLSLQGSFWNEGGTVELNPRSKQTTIDVDAATKFQDLTIDSSNGAGEVLMDSTDDLEVNGTFTVTGKSCADTLRLRPTGSSWTLNNTGGATSANYVDLANTTFWPPRTVTNSWNAGSNPGVTFSSPCASAAGPQPPDTFRVNGTEHATDVVDSPAPSLQWANRAGANVDTADIDVLSSSPANLMSLYRFDAGAQTTDSSGNGNTLTDNGSSQVAGRYGTAMHTTSAQTGVNISTSPTLAEYTIDGWFRRGPLTGSDVVSPELTTRGTAGFETWWIGFLRDSNKIMGEASSGGGSNWMTIKADATPYTDNQWHHVALTYADADLRFYIDGELIGSASRPGTLDIAAGWNTRFGYQANADMDDWSVRSVEASSSEIRGYYRTKRRHMDTVLSSTLGS